MNFNFIAAASFEYKKPLNLTVSCSGYTCNAVNVTVLFPNSTTFINNQPMISNGYFATYTLTPNVYGDYVYFYSDGGNRSQQEVFSINYSGKESSTSQALIYAALLFLFVTLFVIGTFASSILPKENKRDEDGALISISWLKYINSVLIFFEWLLLVAIFYLASNVAFAYLGEQLFANILFVIFRILMALTIPYVVIWFIWIFVNAFQDAQLKKQMEQGFFGGRY